MDDEFCRVAPSLSLYFIAENFPTSLEVAYEFARPSPASEQS